MMPLLQTRQLRASRTIAGVWALMIAIITSIFEQMSARGGIVSVRRNHLIRSIHNLQTEHLKSSKRESLMNTLNPPAEVYRLKQLLQNYNIQYFPLEILQILHSIRKFIHNHEFCLELKKSYLLEDLLQTILGELKRKPYLDAPVLAEEVVRLASDLVAREGCFLQSVQEDLDLLLSVLNRYPLNHKIVERVAGLLSYTQLASTPWKQQLLSQQLSNQSDLISKIVQMYTVREGYEMWSGPADFMQYVERGEWRWAKNAVFAFEISFSLLLMTPERQQILKTPSLKQSVYFCLQACLNQNKQLPSIQEQLDSEQWNESTHCASSNPREEAQQKWDYLMILTLDVILLREELVTEGEVQLLKENLKVGLQQFNRSQVTPQIVIKIIRILYEQVIMDEQDLKEIVERAPALGIYVEGIVNNDFL